MSAYNQLSNPIIGIDVFLERFQTRLYVGKLEKKKDAFHFTYESAYLKTAHILSLGPEFPLTRQHFVSADLFPSFLDRLPDPDNPAYHDYCAAVGIPIETKDPILLLATIGKRGPSSFIFEPIYEDTFTFNDCEQFREKMCLTMQDFAHLFDVSLSILQKIKAGGSSGKEILKRLEIVMSNQSILHQQIKQNMKWLHTNTQRELMSYLLKENFELLTTQTVSFERAYNLIEQINDFYQYLVKEDEQIFTTKIKPIFKIAEYFKAIGCDPERITFCSTKQEKSYDGEIHWYNQDVHLKVTHTYILYADSMKQSIDDLIQSLHNAFNEQNKHDSYKDMWLIITLPLPGHIQKYFEDNASSKNDFHKMCHTFWKNVDIHHCKFKRVFIVQEKFIRNNGKMNVLDTAIQNVLWDSGMLKSQ